MAARLRGQGSGGGARASATRVGNSSPHAPETFLMNWAYLGALDFGVIWDYREQLLAGLGTTLLLMTVGSFAGLALGTVLAMGSQSKHRIVRLLIVVYVEVWRNTPLLVQIFWIHFALPMLTGINTSALTSGIIALVANVTAYFAEIVRAGIQAVDRGQWEAARALGLPAIAQWYRVILPQALRIVVPPIVNLLVSLLKATAILSVLSINDLMRVVISISNYTFKPVEFLTFAALVYFAVGATIGGIGRHFERRLASGGRKYGV